MLPDEVESQKFDEQKRLESHWEEMQMEFHAQEDDYRREPYEVVEETYQRSDGSRYKIVKILERRTCKIIGQQTVELKRKPR